METELKTTKTPNKKSAPAETEQVYFRVSTREYLTMLPPFNVTLFPGTSAVIAVDHRDEIPESYHALLAITEINREEYDKEISTQGILGKK